MVHFSCALETACFLTALLSNSYPLCFMFFNSEVEIPGECHFPMLRSISYIPNRSRKLDHL